MRSEDVDLNGALPIHPDAHDARNNCHSIRRGLHRNDCLYRRSFNLRAEIHRNLIKGGKGSLLQGSQVDTSIIPVVLGCHVHEHAHPAHFRDLVQAVEVGPGRVQSMCYRWRWP